ncbi:MAG TPA: hypothetical protein VGC09_14465 [Rhodopila sp.]
MTRISNLLLATGLVILPVGAFAQQSATPAAPVTAQPTGSAAHVTTSNAKTASQTGQMAMPETKASAPGVKTTSDTRTPAAGVKTTSEGKPATPGVKATATKETRSAHAKLGSKLPAANAKTVEPNKS